MKEDSLIRGEVGRAIDPSTRADRGDATFHEDAFRLDSISLDRLHPAIIEDTERCIQLLLNVDKQEQAFVLVQRLLRKFPNHERSEAWRALLTS